MRCSLLVVAGMLAAAGVSGVVRGDGDCTHATLIYSDCGPKSGEVSGSPTAVCHDYNNGCPTAGIAQDFANLPQSYTVKGTDPTKPYTYRNATIVMGTYTVQMQPYGTYTYTAPLLVRCYTRTNCTVDEEGNCVRNGADSTVYAHIFTTTNC